MIKKSLVKRSLHTLLTALACLACLPALGEQTEKPGFVSTMVNYFTKSPDKSSLAIGVITIEGPIDSSMAIVQELLNMAHNPAIDAILLIIDSPGGRGGHSQHINEIIVRIRELKPLVCFIPDMAFSGGYYIAAAAPLIIASPDSSIGSIGAVIELPRKAESIAIKSGKFKRPEYESKGVLLAEHEAYYQELVQDGFELFCNTVARLRNVDPEIITDLQARWFTARKALELKLIDGLGTIQEAVAKLYTVVRKKDSRSYTGINLIDARGNPLTSFPISTIEELISSSCI